VGTADHYLLPKIERGAVGRLPFFRPVIEGWDGRRYMVANDLRSPKRWVTQPNSFDTVHETNDTS
jgi:hypothetical protein